MLQHELDQRHSDASIEAEIVRFEERLAALGRGQITDEEFRPFRLKHGVYGQRQPGVQMLRVKVPSGVLTPEQLRTLAHIALAYSTGRGHVTTRENLQFHFVQLENVPAIMRLLARAGLTTREACGNTVRNVTACPLSGICPGESFDVTPYALGVTRFLLRHPDFHELPRKFKLAFSGCEDDGNCALAGIHDIGLIAQRRGEQRGFKVLVGGGLGSLPTEAAVLAEFLPVEELLPTVEAVLRVFNQFGNRGNKHKARMKFVLREKGIEQLRRLVAEARRGVVVPPEVFTVASPVAGPLVRITPAAVKAPQGEEFDHWMASNVMAQRQAGYAAIWVKLAAGRITAAQLSGLADLLDLHQLPGLRLAVQQNLLIPWVPAALSPALHEDLRSLELATPGARTIADVTGCPGATTCNLGITRSLTLAEVLAEELANEQDSEVQKMKIKISGCPNSCGQHHIADIGLYGNARKVGDQQAPFYQLLLGGEVSADGVRFAQQALVVGAKRIPATIRKLIELYRKQRSAGESFRQWLARSDREEIIATLAPIATPAEDSQETFFDWGDHEEYSLKLGRGECA